MLRKKAFPAGAHHDRWVKNKTDIFWQFEGEIPSCALLQKEHGWDLATCEVQKAILSRFMLKSSSFYQDRLGTNIGKVEGKRLFSQARRSRGMCTSTILDTCGNHEDCPPSLCRSSGGQVRTRRFSPPFFSETDNFAKTGSGQA